MTWQVVTAANAVVAVVYFAIARSVVLGLVRTGQLRKNKLGTATALIFLTCGVHHGVHAVHMLVPSFGIHDVHALALRQAWHWQSAVWDVITAIVGIYYLSLRGSYASVLRGAQMFEDLKVRERQAIEINDNIVQGLTVAQYAMDAGRDDQTRKAIEESLRRAQEIIDGLLTDGEHGAPDPGSLRRAEPARIGAGSPT
jgi:hypothetical protein